MLSRLSRLRSGVIRYLYALWRFYAHWDVKLPMRKFACTTNVSPSSAHVSCPVTASDGTAQERSADHAGLWQMLTSCK